MKTIFHLRVFIAVATLFVMGGTSLQADDCCYDPCCETSYSWIGASLLGAAIGAGTGYAAGHRNHSKHGKRGEKGETGDQGLQGDQGPQGVAGFDGQPGVDGPNGPDGPNGQAGPCCECEDCSCSPAVNTNDPVEFVIDGNSISEPTMFVTVEAYDPQKSIGSVTIVQGNLIEIASFGAAEPKLTGTYLFRFIAEEDAMMPTSLGTVCYNNNIFFDTPVAVYSAGDEVRIYVDVCDIPALIIVTQ